MSFTPSTKVLLASGLAVAIASLKPGDKVLATNVKTGKTTAEPVTAVLVHHDTNRYDLTVKTGHRTAVIHTTRTHLFWDATSRQWVKAGALKYGSYLRTLGKSMATMTRGVTARARSGWMWDLTVAGDHDFYIRAGSGAVLVHNCPVPGAGNDPRALESGYTEPTELHHVLPQQFRSQFGNAGLNVDEATVRLPSSVHQAAHDVGWNSVWEDFFGANPNPSSAEIVNQASDMMWEFGLDRYSLGVEPYG